MLCRYETRSVVKLVFVMCHFCVFQLSCNKVISCAVSSETGLMFSFSQNVLLRVWYAYSIFDGL